MKGRLLSWCIWLLALGVSIWLGFEKQWSVSAWFGIGLVLAVPVPSLFFFLWQRWFARNLASLPAEERQRRLDAMDPEQREVVVQWMQRFAAHSGRSGAKVLRREEG
jgi:hypothetical protein